MKIALISDIHGNFVYLSAVAEAISRHQPDRIFCLGDLVGYYDSPRQVIDWCIENKVTCVKGNHEKFLLGEIAVDPAKAHFYRSQVQSAELNDAQLQYLRALPEAVDITLAGKRFYFTHSKPGDCVSYAYEVTDLDQSFLRDYNFYCFGHTHIPMVRYHYGTAIVNPGSIGQPRDFSRQPSYAMIDLENDVVSIHKLTVDHESYCKSLLERQFEPKMVDVLQRAVK